MQYRARLRLPHSTLHLSLPTCKRSTERHRPPFKVFPSEVAYCRMVPVSQRGDGILKKASFVVVMTSQALNGQLAGSPLAPYQQRR